MKLLDICDLIVDCPHSTAKNEGKGYPLIRTPNIGRGRLNLDSVHRVLKQVYLKRNQRATPQVDDLILAREAPVGNVAIIQEEKVCLGQRTVLIRPNKEKVDANFLVYYLLAPKQQHLLISSSNGATVSHLNMSTIRNLEINLPEMSIQKKIGRFLSKIDDLIGENEKINKNLLKQAQSIFTQEFLMFNRIPDGWKESSLLGIADYLNGLAMQKYRPKDNEQGLPVLKIKELRQGYCDFSSKLCSPSIKPEYIIHDGDVIFSWSGSLLVDLWCGGTCGLNQHLFKVTSSTYDKWFYYAWTKYHLQKFAAIAADMATTMGHIKREELSKAEVLIPSQSDYNRIGSLLAPLYELVISNRIENRKLASLRDELLPQLMSGQLDVSEVPL